MLLIGAVQYNVVCVDDSVSIHSAGITQLIHDILGMEWGNKSL